ncbi:MAG: hypothetical protein H6868_06960 [Rhodospirillales bacterium]|nr:hypothetical protein [Rhodospirillales bacterium]
MSALLNVLDQLDQSVSALEDSANIAQERAARGGQTDLFGGAPALDPAVLAQKLDIAIERVEQVLREG